MLLEIDITREILIAIGFTAAFGVMFFISELLYLKYKVEAEITRKFIHVTCGTIAMLVPIIKPNVYTIIVLGILFSIFTFYMLKKGLLPSVHAVKRNSYGSVLFPIGVVLCTIFGLIDYYGICFFIPMANMIFSDTIAAIVGINYPIKKYTVFGFTKSIGGNSGFFVSAFVIFFSFCHYVLPGINYLDLFWSGLFFGVITTLIESVSVNGWDDITVPVSSFLALWVFLKNFI